MPEQGEQGSTGVVEPDLRGITVSATVLAETGSNWSASTRSRNGFSRTDRGGVQFR